MLLVLGYWVAMSIRRKPCLEVDNEVDDNNAVPAKGKVTIPWFALGFLVVIGFNSLNLLPAALVEVINYVDTFLLTMAMVALGAETSLDKFKKAGAKPFVLAFLLYIWLLAGGWLLAKYLAPVLM